MIDRSSEFPRLSISFHSKKTHNKGSKKQKANKDESKYLLKKKITTYPAKLFFSNRNALNRPLIESNKKEKKENSGKPATNEREREKMENKKKKAKNMKRIIRIYGSQSGSNQVQYRWNKLMFSLAIRSVCSCCENSANRGERMSR